MAKRIIEMVRAKKATMKKTSSEATQNAVLASAAIHGGVRSPAWRNYMMQFVEQNPRGTPADPRQLDRLLATDGTLGDPVMDLRRAYLVGNAPCGTTTTDNFTIGVNTIDLDLSGGPLSDPDDLPPHPKGQRKRPSNWPK